MLFDKLLKPDQSFSSYKWNWLEIAIAIGVLVKAPFYFKASAVQVRLIWKVLFVTACCKNSMLAKVMKQPCLSSVQSLGSNSQIEGLTRSVHEIIKLNFLSMFAKPLL